MWEFGKAMWGLLVALFPLLVVYVTLVAAAACFLHLWEAVALVWSYPKGAGVFLAWGIGYGALSYVTGWISLRLLELP